MPSWDLPSDGLDSRRDIIICPFDLSANTPYAITAAQYYVSCNGGVSREEENSRVKIHQ